MTEIIKLDVGSPNKELIESAARIIKAGGLVAFPTETVYGLGADATDADASKKIYAAKGRPSDNPLIIHIAEPEDAEKYAYTNELYYKLAKAFMPGPLTVILPKKDTIPSSVTGGLDSVAVRCPSHPIARALIRASDTAIAAPSANLSGSPSPTCAEHVIADLSGKVDMIIDGGSCEIGLESTIVKISDNSAILLRPGMITCDALRCVLERLEISHAVTEMLAEGERPQSPGMKYRHYAPRAQLILLDGDSESVIEYMRSAQKNESCAIICYDEDSSLLDEKDLIKIGGRDDLETQASTLFSALRQCDSLSVEKVYAHLPSKEGIGLALYNRMIRAAAHTIKKV
ncbi:MAG: threonylcarbamoyl-AMP synthase [Ruminococcaceae bacterium]|nr:threonylcarbamoyl-AMP synthase [Oscillospiraceae bacterium]